MHNYFIRHPILKNNANPLIPAELYLPVFTFILSSYAQHITDFAVKIIERLRMLLEMQLLSGSM